MNATTTELWRMGATELAAAIRTKQVSSREVVEAHLRRIDEVNPVVNTVNPWDASRARRASTSCPVPSGCS